ncbi:MAG: MSCRAMM family protein [Candidatus Sulfotelmatobacter sp.]
MIKASGTQTRKLSLAALVTIALSLVSAAQSVAPAGTFRIAGTLVSKSDGHHLPNARITLRNVKNPQKADSVITGDDGRFEFTGLAAGKYSITGAKRGFITASYDQHELFSTAIVTGAGVDTENLTMKLAPDAVISGKILDEVGDPIRRANVTLYIEDRGEGFDRIRAFRNTQTDDLGAYEFTPLAPGTFFLSATAKPWYAFHPRPENTEAGATPPTPAAMADRSLDVAYPLTYYPDTSDVDGAAPILIRGGERLQFDLHLNPVPALRILFHVPTDAKNGYGQMMPRLEQPAFDGMTGVNVEYSQPAPGVWELTGIPAGRYDVHLQGGAISSQISGVDLSKDEELVDATKAEALSNVKIKAQIPGETSIPSGLIIGLRVKNKQLSGWKELDAKGETELESIPAGKYEIVAWGRGKLYSIARVAAEGAQVSGHAVEIAAGSSPSLSVTVAVGTVEVEGTAKRAGKGFAGAMIVLVPSDTQEDRDFRRDQSDLDGTFSLRGVVPGAYKIVAIEDGWDLDWSQPEVIAAYAKHSKMIEIGNGPHKNLADAVEVQKK